MRVLVYPHLMEIGGSQLNAIELAEQVQAAGHDVVMFAPPGPLNAVAGAHGLDVVPSPSVDTWPTVSSVVRLIRLVRERSIDVVHGYEWGPSVELALGPYGCLGVPMLTTVMSMDVPDLIPTHSPLVVGTAQLAEEQLGQRETHLIEPWIDTVANRPGATDAEAERRRFGLAPDDFVLSVVCRLTSDLGKADGVLAAMQAVRDLNAEGTVGRRVRLLVVGDGEEISAVRNAASVINADAGADVVVAGPRLDPRAAYDCADVVVGMGSSALKGLAFGKPLIVQGENGYWLGFSPENRGVFDHQGFFGQGVDSSTQAGADLLRAQLRDLSLFDPEARGRLGEYGRSYVESNFSLTAATSRHLKIYAELAAAPPTPADRRDTWTRTAREVAKLRASLALSRRAATRARRPAAGTLDRRRTEAATSA